MIRPDWQYFPFGLVILMSLIDLVQSTTTCNSFPKIFGGSSSHTGLDDIDVYNDYLALAGTTYDNSLTGISDNIPTLALASISTEGYYYWAKALSSKTLHRFYGV